MHLILKAAVHLGVGGLCLLLRIPPAVALRLSAPKVPTCDQNHSHHVI